MNSESKPVISRVNDRVDYEPPQRFHRCYALLQTLLHLRPQALTDGYKLLLEDFGSENDVYAQALRLLRLAEYLLMLPDDYEQFSMDEYSTNLGYRGRKPVKCGTAACAMGHAPYAVGAPRRRLTTDCLESWDTYSTRVFGDLTSPTFGFFFAGMWTDFDNTPHGAAARILFVLHYATLLSLTDNSREVSQRALGQILQTQTMKSAVGLYEYLKTRGDTGLEHEVEMALRLQPDPALYEGVL